VTEAVSSSVRAYIGLGSNLHDPAVQIEHALAALMDAPDITLLARSRLFWSAAMLHPGQAAQPDYCNAVCVVNTPLAPYHLLQVLQSIEKQAGRQRGESWAARVLDLDLLHVEGVVLNTPDLILPHPGIAQRSFVLLPLTQVAPDLWIEGVGDIARLAHEINRDNLRS
jgi:2-amino-4-hydroxy-6-hydroxymethyldihydropteridine diphosphokinase